MIYLDYSATTPVIYDVLETLNKSTRDYIGNNNSLHTLGVKSKALLNSATKQIAELLSVSDKELVFTSGSTESNNLALKGVAFAYAQRGRKILVSRLEHPSIYSICDYLKTFGFKIEYIENNSEGLIDLEDLKKKIDDETILISICAVNSELGIRQPLKIIKQIIKKENPNTIFHSDMTQAVGKVPINMYDVDMASMSAHKIFGPKGVGLLYKTDKVQLVPLIHGTSKESPLRAGTTPLPLIVAFSKALRLALNDVEKKEQFVRKLNEKIVENLEQHPRIILNKTRYSIPHILNISLMDIKPETFIHALEEYEIYVGTNTACSSGDLSETAIALFNDQKRASTTIRISISHVTTNEEINKFINIFNQEYNKLLKVVDKI